MSPKLQDIFPEHRISEALPADLERILQGLLDHIVANEDPLLVGMAASEALRALQDTGSALSVLRKAQARQLVAEGWTLAEIGEAWNMARQRVAQIVAE